MKELLYFEKKKLNNKGFEKPELVIIVGVLAIIIVIGIIIGVILSTRKPDDNGIVMISYNGNGATGSMEKTECKTGSNCIIKNNTFINEGYQFVGWGTSEGETNALYKINDTYPANSDITLYAIWKLKEITITYNANGGTGIMDETKYTYSKEKVAIPENIFEKTGYTFNTWHIYNPTLDKWYGCTEENTTCNGTEKNVTLGWYDRDEIKKYYDNPTDWDATNSQQDIVYYAQWGESVFEIAYELNGGTNGKEAPISGVYGSTITISEPSKAGFTFTGWTVTGTDAKIEKNNLTIGTSDILLTANWTARISDYIQYLYNDSSLREENSLDKDSSNNSNIRYVGSKPNNYVKYNNELWRIIGVFNVNNGSKTTKRVKLIREENLLDASWDSSASNINNGNGINEWSQADIKSVLNDYYAGDSSSCRYSNGPNQASNTSDCTGTIKKLNQTARNMIENAIWNLGAIAYKGDDGNGLTSTDRAYSLEKGSRTGKQCKPASSGGNCTDNISRTTTWNGKVGLIYPSDYGYASSDSGCRADISYNASCNNNNWLSNGTTYWTITPRDSSYFANATWFIRAESGCVDNLTSAHFGIRPTVYLKSEVTILSGAGTSSNPYKLGM